MIFLQIFFWVCVALLVHSYFIYPFIVWIFSSQKVHTGHVYTTEDNLPCVSILLAVYNEEKVIREKILSTLQSNYPVDKIEFLIGSDASKDKTDDLVRDLSVQYQQIKFFPFISRTGKAGIMNWLSEKASHEILLLTDANVFFTRDTIYGLMKHFKRPDVALVAGNILNSAIKHDGISRQESMYQALENNLKNGEGILWGAMMGAFGGCYSLRKSFFSPTPDNFIVDDFYITIAVLEKGGKAISELNAICYEDVSNKPAEEFRRKSRIATGNFQIIGRFWKLLSPSYGGIAFAFLSHKVLRWFGPFFILAAYLCSFVLSFHDMEYKALFWIQTLFILIPVIDLILRKLKIHFNGLRYISHFYMMNLALLNGFIKFLTGVKNNVWQPTQRNQ